MFLCPKCRSALVEEKSRAVCENNHSYDRAKEGYYNLLITSTALHGDNKEMVAARRVFLQKGFYRPLADRIAELVLRYTSSGANIVDFGSGEGYYTDIVERTLYEASVECAVYGFDISKDAVRAAAKKNKRIRYSVASAYHTPFADGVFNLAINLFSPLAREEVERVLTPEGVFIMAIPDVMHLYELKEQIYDTPYKNTVEDTFLSGFELISDEPLSYDMLLSDNETVRSLFRMTPYAYRTKKSDAEKINALDSLKVGASFRILVYRRNK